MNLLQNTIIELIISVERTYLLQNINIDVRIIIHIITLELRLSSRDLFSKQRGFIYYEVATISRILKIIGLFCKRAI